jgi:PAS domain S-box-containing protein
MSNTGQDLRIRDVWKLLAVSAMVFLATWASLLLMLKSGLPVACIWLPNAMLMVVLLKTPKRQWPAFLICGFVANFLAHPLFHRNLSVTFGFVLGDCLEVFLTAWALRKYCGEKLDLVETRILVRFLVICVVGASGVFAVFAMGWLFLLGQPSGLEELKMRYAGHALGMATIFFTAWALEPGRFRPLFAGRRAYRSMALFALLTGVAVVNFTRHSYPFPFIIFTLLLIVTFQLGLAGAVVGSFIVSAIAMVTTLLGYGPFMMLVNAGLDHRIPLLQAYVTTIMFGTLLLALQLEQRQRAENKLRTSEQLLKEQYAELENYYSAMPVGLSLLDRDLRYIRVNHRMADIYGHSPEDCVGKRLRDFMPEVAEVVSPVYQRVLATGEPALDVEIQGRAQSGSGGARQWLVSYFPLKGDDGTVQRICAAVLEITERKRAEEELRLAEKRLHEFSRQLLSVREVEKRHLSSVLHHDVGSIAVSITARLTAAEEDLLRGQNAKALTSVQECGRLFETSVSRLKTLAVELRPPDLDLLGLSTALRQHVQRVARDATLKILFTDTANGQPISPEIQTVLFRIAQECLNNVVKHAQAAEVRLRLGMVRGHFRLAVMDNGIGFDPSRPVDEESVHLGVRAMQEMAGALGGRLAILSRDGKGTKVSVMIPCKENAARNLAQ